MLRKSSSQQAIMADYKTLSISPYNKNHSSSFLNSPRNFSAFSSKGGSFNDSESLISPTSILGDSKSSPAFSYPFCSSDVSIPPPPKDYTKALQWENLDSKGVGLGILDALAKKGNSDSKLSKPGSPAVLFCSKLKIEIPSNVAPFTNDENLLLKSPSDFGIKTRNSHVCPSSSPFSGLEKSNSQQRVLSGLSMTEMENSEEYTCVISHGPNPKTTHIFDDCVIDSCYGDLGGGGGGGGVSSTSISYPSESFLSFCYTCKKNLDQGNDIYIYRGEKSFCSSDCRYKEMRD